MNTDDKSFNLKCGVLTPDGQVDKYVGFRLCTWTAKKSRYGGETLAERIERLYPEKERSCRIVGMGKLTFYYQIMKKILLIPSECWLKDTDNDPVVIPSGDVMEAAAALNSLQTIETKPIKIFIQPRAGHSYGKSLFGSLQNIFRNSEPSVSSFPLAKTALRSKYCKDKHLFSILVDSRTYLAQKLKDRENRILPALQAYRHCNKRSKR